MIEKFFCQVLTRDSVTVSVDAVVYSRIVDPVRRTSIQIEKKATKIFDFVQVTSVTRVSNVQSATQLLAQTTLRNMLGTKTLQEILSDRENIANRMEEELDHGTTGWGVKVERVEM